MKTVVDLALDTAQARGATYADVRLVEDQEQTLRVKNGMVEALTQTTDHGLGVRVISQGALGAGRSTTSDSTSNSAPRSATKSRTAGSVGC